MHKQDKPILDECASTFDSTAGCLNKKLMKSMS